VGQALRNVCHSDVSRRDFLNSDSTDIVLNQLIQFYSNNATNLHHLTTHSTNVLTYKMAIAMQPQICDLTSHYLASKLA